MFLTLLLLSVAQLGPIQYGGIPSVKNANITLHQVTFAIKDDLATVQSDSRLVVAATGNVTINIPLYRQGDVPNGSTDALPTATVDKQPIVLHDPILRMEDGKPSMITGTVQLVAGNHNLHVRYQSVAARTGLGHKQRAFAYALGNNPMLSRLEFVYHYDQDTVFNVPDMEPSDWKWQTGKTGTQN